MVINKNCMTDQTLELCNVMSIKIIREYARYVHIFVFRQTVSFIIAVLFLNLLGICIKSNCGKTDETL